MSVYIPIQMDPRTDNDSKAKLNFDLISLSVKDLQAQISTLQTSVAGNGSILNAVLIHPATTARNTVIPTNDIVNLTLKSIASQTAAHLRGLNSAGTLQWSIGPGGAFSTLTSGSFGTTLTVTGQSTLTDLVGIGGAPGGPTGLANLAITGTLYVSSAAAIVGVLSTTAQIGITLPVATGSAFRIDWNGIGTPGTVATGYDGLVLSNTTAATSIQNQNSPRIRFSGRGWKTNATAASNSLGFIQELRSATGAAAPEAQLVFSYFVTSGTYTDQLTLSSVSGMTLAGAASISGAVTMSSTLGASGLISADQGIKINSSSGTGGAGRIINSATIGLKMYGVAGSASDFGLVDPSGTSILTNPTGTLNLIMAGAVTIGDIATFSSDVKLAHTGAGIYVAEGTNATMGTATLVLGTKTVSTTKVTASSRIFLTSESLGTITSPVAIAVTARSAGTSFTITSANLTDTSTVAWIIIEPD